jgi:hypothetical protein
MFAIITSSREKTERNISDMKVKIVSLTGLLVAAVFATGILGAPNAAAAGLTCTWTGQAGDKRFSSASNWSGCNSAAPTSGDQLVFNNWSGTPDASSSNQITLTNDLASVVFAGLTVPSTATGDGVYVIDKLAVADGATLQRVSGAQPSVYVENLSSSGKIILDNTTVYNITAATIEVRSFGGVTRSATAESITYFSGSEGWSSLVGNTFTLAGVKNITIENGAKLVICGSNGFAGVTSNFTFGGGSGAAPEISLSPCMGADGQPPLPSSGIELKGTTTLLSDATITSLNSKIVVSGNLVANGHTLTTNAGTKSLVMGKGTLGDITLTNGSVIAPGLSPGCLNTGNITWTAGAEYSFELGGTTVCSEYDQLKVAGTVNLGNGTLVTVPFGGFVPAAGQVYVIIDNDGTDAVTGTFAGLVEGATFTQNGVSYKISYVGGDGNDVTLTVQAAVTAPNTGFSLVMSQPLAVFGLATAAAIALGVIGRKLQKGRV